MFVVFIILAIVIMFCCCYITEVEIESKVRPKTTYRHPTNGKILRDFKTFYNWGISDEEFIAYVKWKVEETGYNDIAFREGRQLVGGMRLVTAVVYYYKK
jgi:hypothetical protein